MAESPSELQAEVEKLERKHAENPEGRYFVPLANDYRKMGELERAEALLREGLRKHPDYLSAHIVLGRCLADRQATTEAADEFTYVLSMDPQNLIALRSLGELAAADGRRDDAGRWYRELLAVDPMNEDARRALAELDAPPEPAPEPEADVGGSWWDAGSDAESEPKSAAAAPTPGDDRHRHDDSFDRGEVDPGSYGEMVDIDAASAAEPPAGAGRDQAEYGFMEIADAGAAEAADAVGDYEVHDEGYEDAGSDDIESVEVVTETIAELYARQGLHDRAAGVYRELIRRRGGDATLERRLAELEAAAAGGEGEPAVATDVGGGSGSRRDEPESDLAELTGATEHPEPMDPGDTIDERRGEGVYGGTESEEESLADDPFAASFEAGFGPAPVGQAGATAEQGGAPGEAEPAAPAWADDTAPPAPARGRTIGGYLSSLASWAPGAAGRGGAGETGEEIDSAMPAAEPGRSERMEGPVREPWSSEPGDGGAEPLAAGGADASWMEATPEPNAAGGAEGDDEEPFPWETEAGGPGAPQADVPDRAPAPEPDLEPDRVDAYAAWEPEPVEPPEPAAGDTAAPPRDERQAESEPVIELEDYFPADEEERAPTAGEAAAPPPSPAAESAGEDDADLESFQAWLRSLKR